MNGIAIAANFSANFSPFKNRCFMVCLFTFAFEIVAYFEETGSHYLLKWRLSISSIETVGGISPFLIL